MLLLCWKCWKRRGLFREADEAADLLPRSEFRSQWEEENE